MQQVLVLDQQRKTIQEQGNTLEIKYTYQIHKI